MRSRLGYLRAFGIGLVTGMRSMTGPAATRLRGGGPVAVVGSVLALGELVVDKLPGVPPRTNLAPLAVRALAGGYAGATVAGKQADRRLGFALGAAGAVSASFLCMRARRALVAKTGLPDPVVALLEDAVAVGGALALTA